MQRSVSVSHATVVKGSSHDAWFGVSVPSNFSLEMNQCTSHFILQQKSIDKWAYLGGSWTSIRQVLYSAKSGYEMKPGLNVENTFLCSITMLLFWLDIPVTWLLLTNQSALNQHSKFCLGHWLLFLKLHSCHSGELSCVKSLEFLLHWLCKKYFATNTKSTYNTKLTNL